MCRSLSPHHLSRRARGIRPLPPLLSIAIRRVRGLFTGIGSNGESSKTGETGLVECIKRGRYAGVRLAPTSMTDGGHSDDSTLAEREEVNDVVTDEPLRISPLRATPIGSNRRPTTRFLELQSIVTFWNVLRPTYSRTVQARRWHPNISNRDATLDVIVSAPGQYTHPPAKDIKPCFPTQRNRYDRNIAM